MGGRLSSWWFGECRSKARLDGKLAIITGCNTGIGKETAKDFVRRGCRVIMACRDLEKANVAAKEVLDVAKESEENAVKPEVTENNTAGGKPKVEVYHLDLTSLESVRQFAQKILAAEPEINLLVNNAGIMACPQAQTKDGHELQLGVNHLGHFLLTCLLIQRICASKEPRIVNVSSLAHKWGDFDFDDINYEKTTYSATSAYSRSKLANILFTKELAKKLQGTGVRTYALHPGVVATELGRHLDSTLVPGMSWIFRNVGKVVAKSPIQGAQTTIYCSVDEKTANETGLYYSDCKVKAPSSKAKDPVMASRLWEESLKWVGLKEDPTLNLPQKESTLIPDISGIWDTTGAKREADMDSLWGRRRGENRGDGDVAGERTPGRRRRKVGRQRCCILVTTALTGAALIAVLLSMLLMVNGEKESFRTIQVHVVFRHGERTPTETYPNDPYKTDENWPEGWGQLTNNGKRQLYELGIFLRSRYGGTGQRALYNGAYKPSEIKILSSYADRCLASAGVLLAGMFPPSVSPGETQVWLDALDWQPVPIRYRERDEDNMIASKKPCPRYDADLKDVYASPEVQKVNQENQDMYNDLTEKAGKPFSSVLDVEFLYNTLQIEELRGLKLPDWIKKWYPERMRPLASLSLALFTRTLPMKKTKSGVLLWEIGDHMHKKITSTKDDSKIYLYSGHDTTIVNILQALGVGDDSLKPEFGAAVIVELLEAGNGDKHIQILLKNSTISEELYPIDLPDCIKPCQIENFRKLPAITKPEEWETDCKIN